MLLPLLRRQVLKGRSMNARSYHRSAVLAFPKTVEYADPIEGPPRRPGIGRWIAASAFALLFLFLISART